MLKNLDRFIGGAVTLFAVLAYFQFFKLNMIPDQIRLMSRLLACGIMFVLILLRLVYQPEKLVKMNFGGLILLMIIAVLPSYVVAYSYHRQPLLTTAMASHAIWFYLLYFFVHYFKISVDYVVRMIIAIGLFVVGLYYLQMLLYPTKFLDISFLRSRGTLRFLVAGMLCTQAAYFYFLNRFFEKSRLMDLILTLLTLSVFILQGSRQLIVAIILLTLIMLWFSKTVKGRVIKTGVIILASFAVFLVFREIFLELTRVSVSQASGSEGGVRLRAAEFFLSSFQANEWSYIFGNGRPGSGSIYGQRVQLYSIKYGYFLSDIGILGDYIQYGFIFVYAGLTMLVKSIRIGINPKYNFLKYYIVMQCFTLATGKGILGGVDVVLLLALYVFDMNLTEKDTVINKELKPI